MLIYQVSSYVVHYFVVCDRWRLGKCSYRDHRFEETSIISSGEEKQWEQNYYPLMYTPVSFGSQDRNLDPKAL
jgi:hypothetical protein